MNNSLKHNPSDYELKSLFERKVKENKERELPLLNSYFLYEFKIRIKELIFKKLNIDLSLNEIQLASVPKGLGFDISIQLRELMKDMKTYIASQQKDIVHILQEETGLNFDQVQTKGPFINIKFKTHSLASKVLGSVIKLGSNYGTSNEFFGKNILVDYSSPNIGKSLHVGHIGTTFLGQIMTNIYKSFGYTTISINHLGDWGTPVGLVKVAEEEFGELPEFKSKREDFGDYYSSLYSEISSAQKGDPSLRERAKKFFLELEADKKEAKDFWKRLCAESIAELQKTYLSFGIFFDCFLGESFYENDLEESIKDVEKLSVANSDGAVLLVDFKDSKFDKVLITKSDGSTTYITRDIAALKKRREIFSLDKTVYVVGTEQNLHFRQLFKIGDLLGYMPFKDCVHIPIGLLTRNGKKISSRDGEALGFKELYSDVLTQCQKRTKESLEALDENALKEVTEKIAQAAMFYSIASITPGKNSEFDIEKITNTKGKSGPSVQYACVRANSILKKVGKSSISNLDGVDNKTLDKIAGFQGLLLKIADYPVVIENCIKLNTAHFLTVYLEEMVQEFTTFIHAVRIKDTEKPLQDIYLLLVEVSKITLENGLRLLNISVPEVM